MDMVVHVMLYVTKEPIDLEYEFEYRVTLQGRTWSAPHRGAPQQTGVFSPLWSCFWEPR